MLEIKNVYKTFNAGTVNEKVALKGLDLTLEDGDFVTVIGGNGAGKSTMLNAVAGVWPVDMGKIIIDGKDVTRLSEHQRAKYIGRVFQDPMMGTAATMQIDENLALAARPGSCPHAQDRHHEEGARRILRAAQNAGSGAGKPYDQQGRPALRRSAPGCHAADGDPQKAQAPAAGRAHRRP